MMAAAIQDGDYGPAQDIWEHRTVLMLEVEGENRYSEDRLRTALGLRIGDPYSGAKVERGIDYLWSLFQVRANLKGRLSEEGLELILEVVELPSDLEPRFIGYAEIDLDDILEWAQLQDRRELYFHQVPRVVKRVTDGYKREGHVFAEVKAVIRDPQEGDDPDAPGDVIFEIIEGPQVNVSEMLIHGNKSLPESGAMFWSDGLQHLSQNTTKGPSLFDWNGAEFVLEDLRADLVAMRNVYRERGYLNAVVELDELDYSEDRSWVTVHVIVDEGERFRVTKVSLEGVELAPNPAGARYMPLESAADLYYPEADLLAELDLKVGSFYLKNLIEGDRFALRSYYGKDGYIEHNSLPDRLSWKWLEPSLAFDLEKSEVEVTYRIVQGRQIRIREVLIGGATHTRDYVIRREISVEPGELADMDRIVSSVRRLNRLEYFSDERNPLEHRNPYFVFRETGEDNLVDIEFIVEEGRVVDFAISGGIDSNDGLFGLLSLTMRNFDMFDPPDSFLGTFGEIYRKEAFHGGGQTLSIQVSPGARRDQSQIVFVEPDIFGLQRDRWSLTLEGSVFERAYEFNNEKRQTARVSFGRQLGFDSRLSMGFTARQVRINDVDPQALADPELYSLHQQIGVSHINAFTFGLSTRSTDAAFNPKSGRIVSWQNEFSIKELGSDWEVFSSRLSWDEYIKLGGDRAEVPPGLRLAAGMGLKVPFGDTNVVPYSERIFLGGFNSLRGFRFRGVGPNSVAENVLGGETMARLSVEYRYPLVSQTRPGSYEKVEMFRMHFFVDAGVLGPDSGSLDFNEMRAAAGFGFALIYPLPLAFNFAWPMREGPGDLTQVFSFNIAIR